MTGSLLTNEDFEALRQAYASGVRTVSFAGPPSRTLTYSSMPEMKAALDAHVAAVARAAGKPSFALAGFRKGFGP